jgi:hypothetical protein
MTTTMKYTGELVVLTCWCGMHHAVPSALREYQERQHRDNGHVPDIYCPLGHAHVPSGKSEATKQRERAEAAETRARALSDQLEKEQAERRRQVKRSKAGICPCCHRSFVQMERHMKAKHPEYGA